MGVEDKTQNAAPRTRRPALRSLIGGATNSVRLVRDRHQRPATAFLYSLRPDSIAEYSSDALTTLKMWIASHFVLILTPRARPAQQ